MKTLISILVAFLLQALPYVPSPAGMYYSVDGSGNLGTWQPETTSGGTSINNIPSLLIGAYCSTDGSGSVGTWAPCGQSGGSVPNFNWIQSAHLGNLNGVYYVDSQSQSSCTVSSVNYTTPFDCALAYAIQWTQTTGASAQLDATLIVGSNGNLTTNLGGQLPTAVNNHATVNIIGYGPGASNLQLVSSLSAGVCMITQPAEATALNYATVTISGLTIDANNNADCLMSLSGLRNSHIEHIIGRGERGGSGIFDFQIGASSSSNSTVFETAVNDVAMGGLGGGYTPAQIAPCTVSGGNPVCTVTSGGTYPSATFTVQIHGVGNGSGACSVYPTPTVTGTTSVTSVTFTGGTCVAPVYVSITPGAKLDYDFLFGPGYTDSTVTDARAIEEPTFAGMKITGHPNTFVHPHCYVGQFVCVEETGSNTFIGLESDSIGGYAAAIEGTGSTYTGTTQIYNNFQLYAGSSLYYVDQGTSIGTAIGFTSNGVSCNGNRQNQGGYHQLVVGTGLPYNNTSAAGGSFEGGVTIPLGVHMKDTLDCSSGPTTSHVYPFIGNLQPRSIFSGSSGTSFASTNNNYGGSYTPTGAITVTGFDIHMDTAAVGCTTFPVVSVFDETASAAVSGTAITLTTAVNMHVSSSTNVPAGHVLAFATTTAAVGCSTAPTSPHFNVEYVQQ